jgi:hypothetical protein
MDTFDRDLLMNPTFTNKMEFRKHFEKFKCFRVIDEEGNVIDKSANHPSKIPVDMLNKMYEKMVTMNEADKVFNAA